MAKTLLLFMIVYFLNVIPAFAPPTWMVFSFIGFRYASLNVKWLALIGALAATSGRLTLAKLSRTIVRKNFLSQNTKDNIDAIRDGLEGKPKLTFSAFLFYAFSPLPSNYLWIAFGLTAMDLRLIAVPFFIGRSISYSFWGLSSSAVSRWLAIESMGTYLSAYFIVSQIVLLYLIYLFTRIDWRFLFTERKLRRLPRRHVPQEKS